MEKVIPKTYKDTYLYGQTKMERNLIEFLSTSDEIDKRSDQFKDIIYDVKRRQVTNALVNVLNSDKVVLLTSGTSLPKSFKVFCSKDIRKGKDGGMKAFIDVSGLIRSDKGVYKCSNVDILIAYLITAMMEIIYNTIPTRFTTNNNIVQTGTGAFVDLVLYVLDHLKVSVFGDMRAKISYIVALYYNVNILQKDLTDTVKVTCARIADIKQRDQSVLDLIVKPEAFKDIRSMIETVKEISKSKELSFDVFIEKWIFLYGPSTYYGMELFVPFCTMITNTYCGVYLNNQKTIEKVVGANNVTALCNAIFKVGDEA